MLYKYIITKNKFFSHSRIWKNLFFQLIILIGIAFLIWAIAQNTIQNLKIRNIVQGFDFLSQKAGIPISQSLISYSEDSSYSKALCVGLINTLLVSGCGIFLATIIGFIAGILQGSQNWIASRIATAYVEIFRNIPLLLQIFFWYFGVLALLPNPKNAIGFHPFHILGVDNWVIYLSNRGLYTPYIIFSEFLLNGIFVAIGGGFFLGILVYRGAKNYQNRTGRNVRPIRGSLFFFFSVPVLCLMFYRQDIGVDFPIPSRFNISGGMRIVPEFIALLVEDIVEEEMVFLTILDFNFKETHFDSSFE